MSEDQSAGNQAGFGQEADSKAIDDLLERINGPNAAVILSQADKTRIKYGLQFLQLEISRMSSPPSAYGN